MNNRETFLDIQAMRVRIPILKIILAAIIILTGSTPVSADIWQPEEMRPWALTDIPHGWSVVSEKNETENPDNAAFTASSPDKKTRIKYILDQTHKEMTKDEIKTFQAGYMSKLGFRICMTKDPIITTDNEKMSYQQTYVRGTEDAAVIGSLIYPEWGQAHYALIMEGSQAVADYYELIPPLMHEHIRPAITDDIISDEEQLQLE